MNLKFKKIASKGKKFITHFQRRSTNEKYKKFSRYNKNKKIHINYSKSKNPYQANKYNIDIKGTIFFPRDIKKINKKIKDIKAHIPIYKIAINHRHLEEIDNTSILILTALISQTNCDIKKYQKNKRLSPKKEIDERLSAIGYWEALCLNHISNNSNLDYLKIVNHNGEKIDNGLHVKIVDFVLKKTGLPEEYKDTFMDAVYEAMANAKEHAYNSMDKKIWLMGAYNKETKETEIIFYDIGIGIFQSLEYSKKKFAKYLNKFSNIFGKKRTLEKLCTTNLSKYKEENRRRGLGMMVYKKLIDELSTERNAILELYSDNSYYSTSKGAGIIQGNIKGTLIRWIIGEKR